MRPMTLKCVVSTKWLIALVGFCLFCPFLMGQTINPPPIEWQRSFGGTNDDRLRSLQQTSDGGFILGGWSNSDPASGASGNKTATHYGNSDFWIVRTDSAGNKLWDRSYGSVSEDV